MDTSEAGPREVRRTKSTNPMAPNTTPAAIDVKLTQGPANDLSE